MADSVIAGRYRLQRRIGAGGMSEVWEATDAELGRKVAVKLLAFDADPARFDREARAAAGLAHSNICALYDYGDAAGRRFMVLELLPGGSLDDRLAAGNWLPDDETRRIAAEVAAGLAHAHQRGVVHRDLKPANILFDGEGRAKIADFGIARTRGATGLTESGTVLGTAAYISPEQARGDPAIPASDVYAFGVILFRMLTGRLPFEAPDALTLASMHRDLPAPPVSELRPDAPPLLESVAAAALAKSPADRPSDGAALVTELGPPPFDTAVEATAVTEVVRRPASRRTPRLLVAFAVAAVAAAGVGLAMALTLGNGTTTPPVATSSRSTTKPAQRPPAVPAESDTSTTAATTTRPTTSTRGTTTATTSAETTFPATKLPPTLPTTAPVTTAPTTTVPPTATGPATTAPPTTTAATTTAPAPTTTPTDTTPTAPDTTTTPTTSPG